MRKSEIGSRRDRDDKASALLRQHDTKPPTLKHRPAITFGILGTVYAISPEGEVKYFDYHIADALEFAGITDPVAQDLRLSKAKRAITLPHYTMWYPEREVKKGQRAYWVLKEDS